jgi:hypothetical protein
MIYQLWGHEGGNLLAEFTTEAEGLTFVRQLLLDGWSADDLSLGPPPDQDGTTPPVLTGPALAARADATSPPAPGAIRA